MVPALARSPRILRFQANPGLGQFTSRLSVPGPFHCRCSATDSFGLRSVAVGAVAAVSSVVRSMAAALGGAPSPQYLPEEKWWNEDTVAVVTGSNKGIGFAIAKGLAEAGLLTVLTSRDHKLGEQALEKLQAQGLKNMAYHQLDITNKASVDEFAKWVKETYGGLDILINNAGFAYKGNVFGANEARTTIATNYGGTRAVTEALLPLIRPSRNGARIVNVCSQAGLLRILGPELQARFKDPGLSVYFLDRLAEEFVAGIETGTYRSAGWPQSMYGVSKVLEAAYSKVIAKQLEGKPEGQRVFVYACCPGYVATDMSSEMGTKTPAQGADTPIFLALLPEAKSTSGLFFYERAERSFE